MTVTASGETPARSSARAGGSQMRATTARTETLKIFAMAAPPHPRRRPGNGGGGDPWRPLTNEPSPRPGGRRGDSAGHGWGQPPPGGARGGECGGRVWGAPPAGVGSAVIGQDSRQAGTARIPGGAATICGGAPMAQKTQEKGVTGPAPVVDQPGRVRNVVLVGHSGAGKTSLGEARLGGDREVGRGRG